VFCLSHDFEELFAVLRHHLDSGITVRERFDMRRRRGGAEFEVADL
jgi:hypothetical protein